MCNFAKVVRRPVFLCAAGLALGHRALAGGGAESFSGGVVIGNWDLWSEAMNGEISSIFFTELPQFTVMTDQYRADFGIVNTTPWANIVDVVVDFPDDRGLRCWEGAHFEFDEPIRGIAFDGNAGLSFRFFRDGVELWDSPPTFEGGPDQFFGLVMDFEFDRVEIWGTDPYMTIDNLHFQRIVPAPPVAALLGLAGIARRRRRN